MAGQSQSVRIPLLEISAKVEKEGRVDAIPQGLTRISDVEITVSRGLPESCYALNIVKEPEVSGTALGIFGAAGDLKALDEVYAVSLAGREPMVCTVVKDESQAGSARLVETPDATPSARVNQRRKSFMTPTPLHIPGSRVSPIPDSAHERIYLKSLGENEPLMVIPLEEVVWMHPMILVVEKPEE